ncbi:MAG: hypothetical protein ACQEWZ_12225 [Pseudomonadota bacterium]
MNKRIKVIQRIAYGYRDTAYFFLRRSVPRFRAKCGEPKNDVTQN